MSGEVRVRRSSQRSRMFALIPVGAAAALIPLPYVVFTSVTDSIVNLLVLVILGSMWNLLAGFGGLVSIGQQAYVGIGAYSVIAFSDLGINPFMAVPLAILICAMFAVPTSWLAFRLHGGYFAVGTWVIAEVYRLVVERIGSLGGATGRSLTSLSGLDLTVRSALTYWLALALAIASVLVCFLMLRGRTGLTLTAIRDSESSAHAAGVNVGAAKRLVYLVSSAGCGAAGAVLVISALSVNPGAIFNVEWAAYMIFIVIIGGIGYLEGPLVGALVFFALQETLADYGTWYLVILGTVGIVFALWLPRGLWGLMDDWFDVRLFPIGHYVEPRQGLMRAR